MRYHSAIFLFVGNNQIRVRSLLELPKMKNQQLVAWWSLACQILMRVVMRVKVVNSCLEDGEFHFSSQLLLWCDKVTILTIIIWLCDLKFQWFETFDIKMKFAWKWSKIHTFDQIHPFIHSFVQLYHSLTFRSIGWSMDTQSTLSNLITVDGDRNYTVIDSLACSDYTYLTNPI